jgi:hypothetical protein
VSDSAAAASAEGKRRGIQICTLTEGVSAEGCDVAGVDPCVEGRERLGAGNGEIDETEKLSVGRCCAGSWRHRRRRSGRKRRESGTRSRVQQRVYDEDDVARCFRRRGRSGAVTEDGADCYRVVSERGLVIDDDVALPIESFELYSSSCQEIVSSPRPEWPEHIFEGLGREPGMEVVLADGAREVDGRDLGSRRERDGNLRQKQPTHEESDGQVQMSRRARAFRLVKNRREIELARST